MKLDVDVLRYLSKDDFRVLTAVEMGMRNHEIVPAELIDRIASLKRGGTYQVLKNLLKYKLLHHDSSRYDGFRLTYLGYDFLAIKTLVNRGVFSAVGRQIGVGKESDIFEVAKEDGRVLAMKLHRLGRVSFRAVKSKRDYLKHRNNYNWLYLSRLAALKEFAFMKALEEHGFPVPSAVDCNRHCVIMSLVQGYPLVQVRQLQNPNTIFETALGLVVWLAERGLIHCDFNEFNIMIDDDEKVTMIDFPQMVSVSHPNAQMYFDRDVECIYKFFRKRYNLTLDEHPSEANGSGDDEVSRPCFSSIAKSFGCLDQELAASGFSKANQNEIEKFIEGKPEDVYSGDEDDGDDDQSSANEEGTTDSIKEMKKEKLDSLHLVEQGKKIDMLDGQQVSALGHSSELETQDASDEICLMALMFLGKVLANARNYAKNAWNHRLRKGIIIDMEENSEEDPELMKRLSKQRQRAIAAARGRRTYSSRNSYKDKGGKSSHSSKVQKQLSGW